MVQKGVEKEFLVQIIQSIEEAEKVLKEAHDKKDFARFTKAKKLILILQTKLEEEIINAGRVS